MHSAFFAKAGASTTGRPPRRRSRRTRLRFRFGRSGQLRCRRAAFYAPIFARPAVNCAVRADKRQCAAVDAADGAFEPSVNANRHFGSSDAAAQRDKADRRLGRHRLCLPKRNERRCLYRRPALTAAKPNGRLKPSVLFCDRYFCNHSEAPAGAAGSDARVCVRTRGRLGDNARFTPRLPGRGRCFS